MKQLGLSIYQAFNIFTNLLTESRSGAKVSPPKRNKFLCPREQMLSCECVLAKWREPESCCLRRELSQARRPASVLPVIGPGYNNASLLVLAASGFSQRSGRLNCGYAVFTVFLSAPWLGIGMKPLLIVYAQWFHLKSSYNYLKEECAQLGEHGLPHNISFFQKTKRVPMKNLELYRKTNMLHWKLKGG